MAGDSQLANTYRQYKRGQRAFTAWLVNAVDALNAAGKRRSKSSTKQGNLNGRQVRLSSRELVRLADTVLAAVTSTKRNVEGLRDGLCILKSVIRDRRECASLYKAQINAGDHDAVRSFERHQYFLGSLAEVRMRLEQANKEIMSAQESSKHKDDATTVKGATPDTRFSNLAVEDVEQEDSDDDDDYDDSLQATRISQLERLNTEKVAVILSDDTDEETIATLCFFEEVQKIRGFLRATWSDLVVGISALHHVTLITECSIILVENAFQRLLGEFPSLATFDGIAKRLNLKTVNVNGQVEKLSGETGKQDADAETEDGMCTKAWTMLSLFRARSAYAAVPNLQHTFAVWDIEKHIEQLHVLGTVLLGLQTCLESQPAMLEPLCTDISTRHILEFFRNQKITTTMVVDLQIQMDIFDVLKEHRFSHQTILVEVAGRILSSLAHFEDLFPDTRSSPLHKSLRMLVAGSTGLTGKQLEQSAEPSFDPLVAALPMAAGNLIHRLLNAAHDGAVQDSSSTLITVPAAHLYKAIQRTSVDLQEHHWLQRLIDIQGPEHLCLWDTDATASPMSSKARAFGIAMGVKSSAYSAKRNKKVTSLSARRVPLPSESKSLLSERKGTMRPQTVFLEALIARFPEACELRLDLSMAEKLPSVLHDLACTHLTRRPESFESSVLAARKTGKAFSMVQLLSILKTVLEVEDESVSLNIRGLNIACYKMFQSIRAELTYRGLVLSTIDRPRELVDEILWKLVDDEEHRLPLATRPIVKSIAQVMNNFHESESLRSRPETGMSAACRLETNIKVKPAQSSKGASKMPKVFRIVLNANEVKVAALDFAHLEGEDVSRRIDLIDSIFARKPGFARRPEAYQAPQQYREKVAETWRAQKKSGAAPYMWRVEVSEAQGKWTAEIAHKVQKKNG